MTFHDLRALRSPTADTRRRAATFLQWLIGAMEAAQPGPSPQFLRLVNSFHS